MKPSSYHPFFEKHGNLMAFVTCAAFWLFLEVYSGTLTSGFHFMDNHEIISMNKSVREHGVASSLLSFVGENLKIGLAPFTFVSRVLLIKFLGANFFLWSAFHLLLAIVTSYCLFSFVYRQGFNYLHALLFPFLTLVGQQAEIWWRLGTGETLGMSLLSAALCFLAASLASGRKYQMALSLALLFLASLTKESFILFIPAYVLTLLWLNVHHSATSSLVTVIRRNSRLIVFLAALFSLEIASILFFIGTMNMGYAGVEHTFDPTRFVIFTWTHLKSNPLFYLVILGLLIVLLHLRTREKTSDADIGNARSYRYFGAITCAIVLPQFLLYMKSGFSAHYLLPLNIGFALFVIFLLEMISRNSRVATVVKRAFLLAILLATYSTFKKDTLPNARAFANEGKATNKFLSTMVANTTPADSILIVLHASDNYEWGFSMYEYLSNVADRKNMKMYVLHTQRPDSFARGLDDNFSRIFNGIIEKELRTLYPCIALPPFENSNEIKSVLDGASGYTRHDFDQFTLYVKDGNPGAKTR